MRDDYDFSKGERGKFYRPDAEFHLPRYHEIHWPDLDEDIRVENLLAGLPSGKAKPRANDGYSSGPALNKTEPSIVKAHCAVFSDY